MLLMSPQRVGARNAVSEFARSLCALLSPTLLSAAHVAALIQLAGELASDGDSDFRSAVLQLLISATQAAPSLFTSLSRQVTSICFKPCAQSPALTWQWLIIRQRTAFTVSMMILGKTGGDCKALHCHVEELHYTVVGCSPV